MYIPEEKIRALCAEFAGDCSVYLSVPAAGEVFTYREDRKMGAASTIKTPLLALLLKDAEEGRVDLDDVQPLGETGITRGSGVLKFLSPDIRLSLRDYATLMMIHSDNTATNKIIEVVGMERANAFFAENGWKETCLARKLFQPIPEGVDPNAGNTTSARDQGDILTGVLKKELVSERVSSAMMSIMACQQLGKFDRSLPGVWRPANAQDPLTAIPAGRVVLAQKGGTLTRGNISHDTAIMLLPNGRSAVLVAMTQGAEKQEALAFIEGISAAVYNSLLFN